MTPRFDRRSLFGLLGAGALAAQIPARADVPRRGTGDLGLIIERADGSALIVETTGRTILGRVTGLGDLSHASVCFSRDERFAFVFGRDGGLTKIDMLDMAIAGRVVQGGNSIGGAISDDGKLIAVSNYVPGGIKVFEVETLRQVADIPAIGSNGVPSKTVGLVDVPGRRFVYGLWDAGEIWIADFGAGTEAKLTKFPDIGRQPYDGNVTSDGRYYLAGLFGDEGFALLDLWDEAPKPQRVFEAALANRDKLPVYKMPHLEGWGQAGGSLLLPATGQHEVVELDLASRKETGRIKVHGQPVFVVMRPDGREAWVNYAHPDNDTVQVIDIPSRKVVHSFKPGPAVLHLEFTPRGHEVWISVRDADRIDIHDTRTRQKVGELPARKPSGIFFTPRAHRIGV